MSHACKRAAMVAALASSFGGCAGLDYVKVPTPTQYSSWTDEDQRAADAMKGVRYYLPRPFLHLKQATPVAQRTALVSFTKKGDYYELVSASAPEWVKRVAPSNISITQALQVLLASEGPPERSRGETQSGTVNGKDDEAPAAPPSSTSRPPSTLHARTGFIHDTDPVTRLDDRMDVVYLPDFEEQYVIQARTGLGSADIETRLRNGWAAEVFAQKVDNSNLIPYVVDQVTKVADAASGIYRTWVPMLAGDSAGAATGETQSGEVGARSTTTVDLAENVILFKIAEVRVAQPGLYPILKPREIRQWFAGASTVVLDKTDPDEALHQFLRLSKLPWIRPDMALIPCPPFTVIGFQTTTDIFFTAATEGVVPISSNGKGGDGPDPNAMALTNEQAGFAEAIRKRLDAWSATAGWQGADKTWKAIARGSGYDFALRFAASNAAPATPASAVENAGAAAKSPAFAKLANGGAVAKAADDKVVVHIPNENLASIAALGDRWPE